MAKCFRFALSTSSKFLLNRTQSTKHVFVYPQKCQTILKKSLSGAVNSQAFRSASPTLAAVKSCRLTPVRAQTTADKELCKLLEKEIGFEEGVANKSKSHAKGVAGFEVKTNDAEVTLTRQSGAETIIIHFNINHSVDADGAVQDEEEETEIVSRPFFTIELSKGDGRTLALQCQFLTPEEMEVPEGNQDADAIVDTFEIQAVSLFSGPEKETTYAVSADVLDGNLYDLLMDMLDERGINEEFGHELMEFSTSYEHSQYLHFLKNLKAFTEKSA